MQSFFFNIFTRFWVKNVLCTFRDINRAPSTFAIMNRFWWHFLKLFSEVRDDIVLINHNDTFYNDLGTGPKNSKAWGFSLIQLSPFNFWSKLSGDTRSAPQNSLNKLTTQNCWEYVLWDSEPFSQLNYWTYFRLFWNLHPQWVLI